MTGKTDVLPLAASVKPQRPAIWREVLLTGAVLLIPLLVAQATGNTGYYYYLGAQIAVWATFAMAFDLLIGFTGITSFGHAMFFGIGAYGAAITYVRTGDFWLALLMGLLAGGVLGVIIGFWVIRTFGVAILLLTFAINQAMWLVILADPRGVTGGDNGLPGLQPAKLFGGGNEISLYIVASVLCLLAFGLLRRLTASPFGDVLKGIRENEQRVTCLGFDTRAYKFAAFVISGALSGVAGGVNAFTQRQASPDVFLWLVSADVMLFALLGGRGTLVGPAMAAGALIIVRSVLSAYTDSWPLFIGVIYVVSALLLPRGVWTTLSDSMRRQK